jgi:hypothetical protein
LRKIEESKNANRTGIAFFSFRHEFEVVFSIRSATAVHNSDGTRLAKAPAGGKVNR